MNDENRRAPSVLFLITLIIILLLLIRKRAVSIAPPPAPQIIESEVTLSILDKLSVEDVILLKEDIKLMTSTELLVSEIPH